MKTLTQTINENFINENLLSKIDINTYLNRINVLYEINKVLSKFENLYTEVDININKNINKNDVNNLIKPLTNLLGKDEANSYIIELISNYCGVQLPKMVYTENKFFDELLKNINNIGNGLRYIKKLNLNYKMSLYNNTFIVTIYTDNSSLNNEISREFKIGNRLQLFNNTDSFEPKFEIKI